jgi:hypothetical protein
MGLGVSMELEIQEPFDEIDTQKIVRKMLSIPPQ